MSVCPASLRCITLEGRSILYLSMQL